MQRLLIVETGEELRKTLSKQLKGTFLVKTCGDGGKALELICSFDPDIIVLDTMLPGVDSLCVLRALRDSGRTAEVLALSRSTSQYTLAQLEQLGVSCVIPKPCTPGIVISHILNIGFRLEYPDLNQWDAENELDNILLSLNFRMGPIRYRCVKQAILVKYADFDNIMMKSVYTEAAIACNGSAGQVEKAIRDAIKSAYLTGDRRLWSMYFHPRNGKAPYPSNEEFIARIADCLLRRDRMKLKAQ